MKTRPSRALRLSLAAGAVAYSMTLAGSAYATGTPPPPPPFTDLLVNNNTSWDIGLLVTLVPSSEVNRSVLLPLESNRVLVSRVRANSKSRISLGPDPASAGYPNGTWGISRIYVSAAFYDRGTPSRVWALPEPPYSPLVLVAELRAQGSNGWAMGAELPVQFGYAAYTSSFANPPTDDYVPNLTFDLDANGYVFGDLRARHAWGANYSAIPSPTSTDGRTRETKTFMQMPSSPTECPCPHNN